MRHGNNAKLISEGKKQDVRHGAAFALFLCCDVSVEVFGAHWDIGQRWPGAAELEFLVCGSQGAAGELWQGVC